MLSCQRKSSVHQDCAHFTEWEAAPGYLLAAPHPSAMCARGRARHAWHGLQWAGGVRCLVKEAVKLSPAQAPVFTCTGCMSLDTRWQHHTQAQCAQGGPGMHGNGCNGLVVCADLSKKQSGFDQEGPPFQGNQPLTTPRAAATKDTCPGQGVHGSAVS